MVDHKTSQENDRYRIADLGYETEHIAKTTGITRQDAFRLIKRYGKNREALVRAAGMLKTREAATRLKATTRPERQST